MPVGPMLTVVAVIGLVEIVVVGVVDAADDDVVVELATALDETAAEDGCEESAT